MSFLKYSMCLQLSMVLEDSIFGSNAQLARKYGKTYRELRLRGGREDGDSDKSKTDWYRNLQSWQREAVVENDKRQSMR